MNLIRVRAWDKMRKKMGKVVAMDWDHYDNIVTAHIKYYDGTIMKTYPEDTYGDQMVFMQDTGLLDKNGKKIYDGDIIHASGHYPGVGWYDTGEHDYDFTAPVKWNKEKAAYTCKQYYLHELNRIVVVGNIFDRDDIKEAD